MKTALHLLPCLAWKRSWALLESSNFDAQPTLSYQRLLMHIYSAISNGNNPTFSNLSVFVTPSCTTVFIHLSELCSQMQEAYILNHISLQQLLICSSANSLWKWKVWSNCPLSFGTKQFPLLRKFQWQTGVKYIKNAVSAKGDLL